MDRAGCTVALDRPEKCCSAGQQGLLLTPVCWLVQMHQYQIVGRRKPSEKNPNPEVFRMKLFAPNTVVARSRFWYYLSLLKKIKRINGEIVEVREVSSRRCAARTDCFCLLLIAVLHSQLFEKKPTSIKNYGFWLRYDSRSGTHNMYKEFRDVSLTAAVEKMCKHSAARVCGCCWCTC